MSYQDQLNTLIDCEDELFCIFVGTIDEYLEERGFQGKLMTTENAQLIFKGLLSDTLRTWAEQGREVALDLLIEDAEDVAKKHIRDNK